MGIGEVKLRQAVFLDRDGVINRNVQDPATGEYGAPLSPEQFQLAPGALDAMAALRQGGFLLFLVSNQPNYAKGKSSLETLGAIHDRLSVELDAARINFAEFFYCYHHPEGIVPEYSGPCRCRKPSPYFLSRAGDEFGLSLAQSWMIGDRPTDIECGRGAGARTILVAPDHPASIRKAQVFADFQARDLAHAAAIVLGFSELPVSS
jgi:D-glycero-D-manno-heptose 1,7-bisphosphate phosphatase